MDTKTAIAELRRLGFSQAAIAAACGLSQGAISHIETGRRKDVRARTHDAILATLEKARRKGDESCSEVNATPTPAGEASHA